MNKEKYLYHVILISFLPESDNLVREKITKMYSTLGSDCGGHAAGIIFWSVQPNLDLRKNIHLVEVAIFKDQESFDKFKKHPKHIEVVELLKSNANWTVGDLLAELPVNHS